jgi:AraC family transcriptional regulator
LKWHGMAAHLEDYKRRKWNEDDVGVSPVIAAARGPYGDLDANEARMVGVVLDVGPAFWAPNPRMSTMEMEFDTVPVTPPARPFLSGRSGASLVTPNGVHAKRTFDGDAVHGELLIFDKRDAAELEFSSQSHLVVLLPDGISGGCEWSNGSQTGKLSTVAPNTILFNPAGDYLWIRKRTSRQHCRMLLLTIDPALVNRLDVGDVNVAGLQFRQEIGIEDQGVRQTLEAIKQEIEAPGLNSRLYIDTLLMLLLTRLMRCASNFATPRQPAYVKGGLSNWRLKRALELLEADLTKTPSLAELAGRLQVHPTFFCRAFKQSTGLSPRRYLLAHRINRAKEMMKDQKRTLTEIGWDCGFSSLSQFSVVFKRITGVSPRIYRLSL